MNFDVIHKNMIAHLSNFKSKNPDIYEFILFNVMSNVATIVNFLVLWIAGGFLFKRLADRAFNFFIFNYSIDNGGLGGFLAFLLAYICAQTVNFYVQRKVVFNATVSIKKVLPIYMLTVTFAGILSIWLPPYVIALVKPWAGDASMTIANIVNILLQVAINYPMLKFVIMKKED